MKYNVNSSFRKFIAEDEYNIEINLIYSDSNIGYFLKTNFIIIYNTLSGTFDNSKERFYWITLFNEITELYWIYWKK